MSIGAERPCGRVCVTGRRDVARGRACVWRVARLRTGSGVTGDAAKAGKCLLRDSWGVVKVGVGGGVSVG
eukprot:1759661-Prymnesium_polylepis.2